MLVATLFSRLPFVRVASLAYFLENYTLSSRGSTACCFASSHTKLNFLQKQERKRNVTAQNIFDRQTVGCWVLFFASFEESIVAP